MSPRHVLTCSHLLRIPSPYGLLSAEKVLIEYADGRQLPAEVVATDVQHDIALLRLEKRANGVPVALRPFDLSYGDEVRIAGLFDPSGFWVTSGKITARNVLDGFAMADAKVRSGYSGGPVFAQNGDAIGMLSQRDDARHAIFVRSDVILAFLSAYEAKSGEQVLRRPITTSGQARQAPLLRETAARVRKSNVPPTRSKREIPLKQNAVSSAPSAKRATFVPPSSQHSQATAKLLR